MSSSPKTEGISREQLCQLVDSSFESMGVRFPELSNIMDGQRNTIVSLIHKYCPEQIISCDDLTSTRKQIDGYLSLLRGEATADQEQEILSTEMKEYRTIARNIRRVLLQKKGGPKKEIPLQRDNKDVPIGKPRVAPFEYFSENLKTFLASEDGAMWTPTSKKALAVMRAPLGAAKITVATERLFEGLQMLYLDIPHSGINDLSYIRHFRVGVEALFGQMAETLGDEGVEYVNEFRQRYEQGITLFENKLRANYSFQETTKGTEPMIWRSTFQKACIDAQAKYEMDIQTEEMLQEFYESSAGSKFEKATKQFRDTQNEIFMRVPTRIGKTELLVLREEMQSSVDELNALLENYLIPHLGNEVAGKFSERYRRMLLDSFLSAERWLALAETDPHGLACLLERDQTREEVRETCDVKIGKVEVQGMILRHNLQTLRSPDSRHDREFKRFTFEHLETFGIRWLTTRTKFQAEFDALQKKLPEIIGVEEFRNFMRDLRQKFVPLERVYLSVENSGVRESLNFYNNFFETLETAVQRVFVLQMKPGDPLEIFGSFSKEDIARVLCHANRNADVICLAAYGETEVQPDEHLEREIHKVVGNLPEDIRTLADLEDIIYWLIGRMEAMNGVEYGKAKNRYDWTKDINRAQFEKALESICRACNISDVETCKLLSRKPESHNPVGDNLISRDELLTELLTELNRAERRIESMNLESHPVSSDMDMVLDELKKNEETSALIAKHLMGGEVQQRKKHQRKKRLRQKNQSNSKHYESNPKILREFFSVVRQELTDFFRKWTPEKISSDGPLIGINSFLLEYIHQCRFILQRNGVEQRMISKVISCIDEAQSPTIQWSSMLLRAQHPVQQTGEALFSYDACYLQSSQDPSSEIATAFAQGIWLEKTFLQSFLQNICKQAGEELPRQLNLDERSKEHLQRYIWNFRRIGMAVCEGHTADGPINNLAIYEAFFDSLNSFINHLPSDDESFRLDTVTFIQDRISKMQDEIEKYLIRESLQRQTKAVLQREGISLQTPEACRSFFSRYAQSLLVERGRQFLYSCITPSMSKKQIQEIGGAINAAMQIVLRRLNIILMERHSKKTTMDLVEIAESFIELLASIDVGSLGLPKGTEERFRSQVLVVLSIQIREKKTEELFSAYPVTAIPSDPTTVIFEEMRMLLRNKNNEELMVLRQKARTKYAEAKEIFTSLREFSEISSQATVVARRFLDAIRVLQTTLYPEYEAATIQRGNELQSLRAMLEMLYVQSQDPRDHDQQAKAARAIIHFTDTVSALRNSLTLPSDDTHGS